MIGTDKRLLLAEGNYLLLDAPDWEPLKRYFDPTVFLDMPLDVLQDRLNTRWAGPDRGTRIAKLEENDLLNVRHVIEYSVPADFVLSPETSSDTR